MQASPLLALPSELRIEIYKQLLNPDPERIHTLYHDRHGREASFGLHPNILRVNKQICSEAISILYDTARVRIYLGTPIRPHFLLENIDSNYSDGLDDPPALFRFDDEDAFEPEIMLPRLSPLECVPSTVKRLKIQRRLEPAAGYIYPQCFQRLRNIQLVTSTPAIWTFDWGGAFFSHTGLTVLRILGLLAEKQVEESPATKFVKFNIHINPDTVEAPLLMRFDEIVKKMESTARLRDTLEPRSNVEIQVEEGVLTKVLRDDHEAEQCETGSVDRDLLLNFSQLVTLIFSKSVYAKQQRQNLVSGHKSN